MNSHPELGFRGISPVVSISNVGLRWIDQNFHKMIQYEAETLVGSDVEALHIMRVASRRLRVAINVFSKKIETPIPKDIRGCLRETGQKLGVVRDFDVLIQNIEEDLSTKPQRKRTALQYFVHYCEGERTPLRREMVSYLQSEPYQHFKEFFNIFYAKRSIRTGSAANQTVPETFARTAIKKKQLALIASERFNCKTTIETLHRLRIAIKKLRYTVEFFMEPLSLDAGEYLERLKFFQDQLGLINDIYFLIQQHEKITHSEMLTNEPLPFEISSIPALLDHYLQQKKIIMEETIDRFLHDYKNSHLEKVCF